MIEKIGSGTLSRPVRRRELLRGAAAVGVAGAFPAIITRRGFAADKPTVVNSIRSLSNPYHATWNKGGEAFAKSVGAEYVTLVTEGNSEKGIADIKAILAKTGGNCVINVDPNDSPDARPIVEACEGSRRLCRDPVEQAGRPASLGLRPELRRPHLVQRRALRQGDGRDADQGDGRQGRHRRARRHRVERAGDRAQGRPRRRRWPPIPTSSCSTSRSPTGRPPRRSRRPTPGSPSSATRSAASGRPTTTWRSPRSRRCAPTAAPARCRSPASTASSSRSRRSSPARWPAPSPGIPFWQGGMGLSIGYHAKTGKFDPAKEPQGAPRVLRHRRDHHRRERPGLLRHQHQGRADSSTGTTSGAASAGRSSTADANCAGAPRRPVRRLLARAAGAPRQHAAGAGLTMLPAPGKAYGPGHITTTPTPAAAPPTRRVRRWRLASWAPLDRARPALRHHRA